MTLKEMKLISSLLNEKNIDDLQAYIDYVKTITEHGYNHEEFEQSIIKYSKPSSSTVYNFNKNEQIFSKLANSVFYLNVPLFNIDILKKYVLKTQGITIHENKALNSIYQATHKQLDNLDKREIFSKNLVSISKTQVFATSFKQNDSLFNKSDIDLAKILYPDAKIHIFDHRNMINFESQYGEAIIIGKKY